MGNVVSQTDDNILTPPPNYTTPVFPSLYNPANELASGDREGDGVYYLYYSTGNVVLLPTVLEAEATCHRYLPVLPLLDLDPLCAHVPTLRTVRLTRPHGHQAQDQQGCSVRSVRLSCQWDVFRSSQLGYRWSVDSTMRVAFAPEINCLSQATLLRQSTPLVSSECPRTSCSLLPTTSRLSHRFV